MTQVLIVDDNDANLYLLRTLLQGHGFEVIEARGGAEALTLARPQPPALIVSDLLMPVMDGYALLRQCKNEDRLKDIPFLVYTATYTEPKDERLAFALGADAFIVKPAEPDVLLALIRDLLARREQGELPSATKRSVEEVILLNAYNDVLVGKLEKKASQLEQANQDLQAEIAERKQTELALLDSQERYRNLFDAIAAPLFVFDQETHTCLAVNDAAVRTYGYSLAEWLGMTLDDLRPEQHALAPAASAGAVRDLSEQQRDSRHRKRDGTVIDVEISGHRLQYGARRAYVTQARDVTEKKRLEVAAARSHELLRAVADGMSDAVFVKDRNGVYLLFNEAAARFVGKSVDDVIGKDDTAILDPETARVAMESDRLVIETNRARGHEVRVTTVGVPRVFEAVKTPYRDADGEAIGVIGVSRDITERRRDEDARRHQQGLLRIAGRVARLGGWSFELATERVTWSDEVCTIHGESSGYQPDIAAALAYYLPDDRKQIADLLEHCGADGTPFDVECQLRTAQGRTVWVRCIGEAVRDPHGRIVSVQGGIQDISDRKGADDERRRLAEQITNTLESITDGFFTLDRDWRFTYVNAVAEGLILRSRESLIGVTLWDAFPATLGSAFEREYRRAVEQNVTVDLEEFFAPLDKWFAVRVFPSEQGLAVYFRDVTASRQAEQAVRLSEERFRLLSNATSDVIWEWDVVTNAYSWNDGVSTLFGYSRDEVEPTFEFRRQRIHPDDADQMDAIVARAMAGDAESWSAEYRFRRRDGGYTPVLDSGYIIRDGEGRPLRMLGGIKDLTERRRFEESLLLRDRAIQAASQGIVVTDPNQPDNPVVFVNGGFERMTGYRSDDVLGRNCRLLQGPGTDAESVREIGKAIAAVRSCSVEVLNYRKDGTPFWNELSITPVLSPAGRLTHFVGVQTDVTERRRLEEEYRQAQKMEAVGRLAGGVAHDFNNLLTVITGYSELVLARADVVGAVRESLASIRDASEQAASLTRQLLGFSRKSLLQPRVLDLNGVVFQTTAMLRRLIGEDILLSTVLDPVLAPVRMDPGQLDQVLMNLAVNARDAMPSGGRLTVVTSNVLLGHDQATTHGHCKAGPHVMLAVSDTGCGMTPEVMARIFEPFYTTKAAGRGTGLGLSMIFGIVEQCGGCIHVESAPGRGSTFKLYLPAAAGLLSVESEADPTTSVRGTETILLVEDEDGVRGLASLTLRMHGYRVLTAADGLDALRIVRTHQGPLDLVLTDVVMPNLGGPALVEQIKADMPDLKVLFMSGYTDDAVVRHGLSEADMAFIAKPYTPLALATKVRQVLDS